MTDTSRGAALALALVPLAGFALLLASPGLDVQWEDHPAHFWLVVGAALAGALLAYATGEAMTGVVGTHGGRSYTVIGDAVNVASRLEAAAPVGGVAVSAETLSRLDDAQADPLGNVQVKGRERPVEAFSLRGVNAK